LRQWMPELNLPAFSEDELRELLPWACAGRRSFEEVRRADWLGLLHGKLTAAQVQAIECEAPERLQVPSGSRVALHYEVGRPPVRSGPSVFRRLSAGRTRRAWPPAGCASSCTCSPRIRGHSR